MHREMKARTKTKVRSRRKEKYRVNSWAAYNESLRERGDITDEATSTEWNAPPRGVPGGQRRYHDLAS